MKSKRLSAVIVTIMSVIIMMGMLCLPASAATSLSKAKITYETNYTYTGKAIKPTVTVKVGSKTLKNKTNYTVSYKNNTNVGKGTITVKGKGSYSGSVSKSFYIEPKAVSSLKATAYSTKIKLSWKASTGASAYQVYQKIDGKWKKLDNTSKTSYTVTDLDSVTKYDFRVRAYAKVGSKVLYSDFKNISKSTTIGKVTELKATEITQNSAKLTWNQVQGATSYIVKITDVVSEYTYDITSDSNSVVLDSLYGQREYSVKIVAKNKEAGITGPNSSAFTFNTALAGIKNLKAEAASATTVKLTWDKINGVDAYQVFYAKYDSSGKMSDYEKFGNIKTNSCTVDGLFSGTDYSFRVRAYTKTKAGTVYSDYTVIEKFFLPVSVAKIQNFKETGVSNNEIALSWSRPSNINGYKLYVNGVLKDDLQPAVTTYRLSGLTSGQTYTIAISAYYKDVEGEKTEISVTTQSGDIQSVTITKKPTSTLKPGETFKLEVSVAPSYASNTKVTYKSQDTSIATVDPNTGLIKAIKDGQTVITVTSVANPNKSASFTLKVQYKPVLTEKIELAPSYTFYEGEIKSLNPTFYPADATSKGYTITGSDHSYSYKGGFIGIQNKTETCKFEDYVYVTSNNLIKGVKATIEEKSDKDEKPTFSFRVTVSATDGSGASATTTIKILPKMISVDYTGAEELPWYYGNSAKLSYKLHDSIADQYNDSSIRFKSSDTSIATVTSDGTVTCKGSGDVTITAYTTDGKYSGIYEFYSRGVVEIDDTLIENCAAGKTYQIKASIKPAGTTDTIIYYTSDPAVATVNSSGLVTFNVASGNVRIMVGLSSDNTSFKEVWFTSGSYKAPSGTNAQLLSHMIKTANVLKTLKEVPGLTRYEATTLSRFTTTADKEIASSLQSMFNSDLKPKTTHLAAVPSSLPLTDYVNQRNVFLNNVPVKGQGYVIEESLSASDISKIEVIDKGGHYYEMKLTLKEESFSALPSASANNRHGKVFDILTQEHIDSVLNKLNSSGQASMTFSSFTQKYYNSTVTIGINKINNHIEFANYDMNIDIKVSDLTLKVTGMSTKIDVSFSCNNIINIDFASY